MRQSENSSSINLSRYLRKDNVYKYKNNSSTRHVLCVRIIHSNMDTNGAEESVYFSEASSFQRLKCMQGCPYRGIIHM